jgi:uncharacterized repeat protein (TIGR04138 family)
MEDFDFVVDLICKEDPRYGRAAYQFVRQGLDHTVKKRRQQPSTGRSPHVTGPELLEGIREYALQEYGPMTLTVLQSWNVSRCSDVGEIVFNLIEHGVLSKTESDKREDFADLFDFHEAFAKPFLPSSRRLPAPPALFEVV